MIKNNDSMSYVQKLDYWAGNKFYLASVYMHFERDVNGKRNVLKNRCFEKILMSIGQSEKYIDMYIDSYDDNLSNNKEYIIKTGKTIIKKHHNHKLFRKHIIEQREEKRREIDRYVSEISYKQLNALLRYKSKKRMIVTKNLCSIIGTIEDLMKNDPMIFDSIEAKISKDSKEQIDEVLKHHKLTKLCCTEEMSKIMSIPRGEGILNRKTIERVRVNIVDKYSVISLFEAKNCQVEGVCKFQCMENK